MRASPRMAFLLSAPTATRPSRQPQSSTCPSACESSRVAAERLRHVCMRTTAFLRRRTFSAGRRRDPRAHDTQRIARGPSPCQYPNLGFPTGLKMGNGSRQRAFRAGSDDEALFSRFQSLGEDRPWTANCAWSGCTAYRRHRAAILGGTRLRSRGPTPALTDVEALTIEIFGETLGLNSDASIWRYACDHLRDWFPGLGTEWNFVRRCPTCPG